ncbi:MAG: SIMPL domain-containing protein [Gemmatimonadales bacterium]
MNWRPDRLVIGVVLLTLGIVLAGWFIGHGFAEGRSGERYVTVKGVSERPADADLALWPLSHVATDDDLALAQAAIEADTRRILAFLARHGLDTSQARIQSLEVTDKLADPYRTGPMGNRFIITQTIMLRSDKPELVQAASREVGELVNAGVVLSTGGRFGPGLPTYLFTRLNDFKPEMIAEATASAREAAEQFAADSRSELGPIRRANQGVFVILPRDQAPGTSEENQLSKTIRVVSTIEYYLE